MAFRPTIGLEIHAELKTQTKMFCACKNDPDETRPNTNVCPICLAHPGTLPVANKAAVGHVLRVGAAVGGTLADYSEFDRKSYFYPDIPKGYQISQYEHPFVSGGKLAGVAITRVHLEEDTARSTHEKNQSLVDFNRAGVPLMELVTEPDIHDAETAGVFARELQLLLRTLGAGEANLEKGEMRIEANISVSKDEKLGTKVEVKNLNSFRSVERAIAFEIERQSKLIEQGGRVVQETRGWDESKQQTFSQRLKEGSADYRYFPEPDLPKFLRSEIAAWSDASLEKALPELPAKRRERYAAFSIKETDTAYLAAADHREFFDAVIEELKSESAPVTIAANYFISDLSGEPGKITPKAFARVVRMFVSNELSSRGIKDVLAVMAQEGGEPDEVTARLGLAQVHDVEALQTAVATVIAAHPGPAADYRAGKEAALQFLVGQAMKATKGAGNPSKLRELLTQNLGK